MKVDDLADLLDDTVGSICRYPEKVLIELEEMRHSVFMSIKVDVQDQAKVVGSKGATIKAIKNIFENVYVLNPKDYSEKSVRIYLESPGGERSKSEKFHAAINFDPKPYEELLGSLTKLYAEPNISCAKISDVYIIEVTTKKTINESIKDSIKWIVTSAAKCNGGSIEVSYA